MTRWLEAVLDRLQRAATEQGAQHGQQVALEFGAQRVAEEARHALHCLQRDVADETVAYHDVGGALEDVVALDVAVEVERAALVVSLQQLAGGLDHFVALDVLGADVQQADGRALDFFHGRDQHRTHDGELVQVMRFAIDVGAQVQHIGRSIFLVRHDAADGRAVDAGHGLEYVARYRHQGAGIAGRDAGLGLAVLDLLDGDAHRRILLAAQGHFERIVHGDLFGGVLHGDARMRVDVQLFQFRADYVLQTDQDQFSVRFTFEEGNSGGDSDRRAVIATHTVDRNFDCHLF